MYRTIQSASHKIKALQQGVEEALKYIKEYKEKEIRLKTSNSLDKLKDIVQISCIDT